MYKFSKKILSSVVLTGMVVSTASTFAATNIGTGSVVGSGALTTNIVWDDTLPWTATGIINWLTVKARVLPVLNMVVTGSGLIDLGTLSSSTYSSGTVNIELGTNAVNGASVTARSTNGGLKNTTDGSININSLVVDGVADSYKYSSALVASSDSSSIGFTQAASLSTEISDNTTNQVLYSSNKPQTLSVGTDDFSFTVSAKPNIETPAGDYSDVVVLTVTGNF